MSDNRSRQKRKVLLILLYTYIRGVKCLSFAFAEKNRCVYITPEKMLPVMKYRSRSVVFAGFILRPWAVYHKGEILTK